MKYLVSERQLGQLLEANKKRREEIIDEILNIQYVYAQGKIIEECIKINKVLKTNK